MTNLLTASRPNSGAQSPEQARLLDALQLRMEKMAAYFAWETGVDPDDLRQEAWLAVLEMLPMIDYSIGVPEQHLLKRARWRMLDVIRWQRRQQHLPLCDVQEAFLCVPPPGSDADLDLLLNHLSPLQRRIVRALLEGYTWREVGAAIGCTSANVAYHVRRIREIYIRLNPPE